MDGSRHWLTDDPINAVREDPKRRGLLFAGSERAVYVSFDDGEHWQSLRLNMPATSIRDLVVKDDDIVVGTHGRSFWILDDMTPLRQLTAQLSAQAIIFYKPQTAVRIRWNMNPDTPLPQEEPAGENPPDGAILTYFLKEKAESEVKLEIFDAAGALIRSYSSNDKPAEVPPNNVPNYWLRPPQRLETAAGTHRFLWNLHYTPLPLPPSYPIAATFQNTEPDPNSPWVLPAEYLVKLTVNGKTYEQKLTVQLDPRVKTPTAGLWWQHDLSRRCYDNRLQLIELTNEIRFFRQQIKDVLPKAKGDLVANLKKIDSRLSDISDGTPLSINRLEAGFATVFNVLHDADMPPTTQAEATVIDLTKSLEMLATDLSTIKRKDFFQINEALRKAKLPPIGF